MKMLKTSQVAEKCEVTIKTVQAWVRAGKLRATRTPGGQIRISHEEVDRVLGAPSPVGSPHR